MIDGCARMGALWRRGSYRSRPGVSTAGVLAFVNSWDEFLLALSFNSGRRLSHVAGRHPDVPGETTFPGPPFPPRW